MTDSVDTDALRKAGDRGDYYQTGEGPLWRAAADEIDRLRADVKASATMHEQARVLADSALKQRDALRAVIEDAPHLERCPSVLYIYAKCTCWKADM